jgi:DNA-binding beta-propeller fold protein YncE
MSTFRRFVFLLVASAAVFPLIAPSVHGDSPYHFIKEIPVGGEGGWDLLSVDEANRRLYVSHATKVVVIDLDKDAVVGEIPDTPGVHGIALAPTLGRAFVSNGRESKASVVDISTLATAMKVDTGPNPDTALYEPEQQEVYMFNGRGKSATVFAAETGNVITTIELPGKPEFAVCDAKAGRIYDNIEDKSEVVAIDAKTHQVVDTWPIAPGEEPSGMAFDEAHHRLFLGCGNKMMVMIDSENGKVIANVPIGGGVDANAFDPGTQLAFSSNGEGNVTIAHEDSPDTLSVVQTLETERGARTMTIDPQTHKIYLPSAKYEPAEAGQRRPKIIPDSFKVLVYGT